jgi:hypothetical protein
MQIKCNVFYIFFKDTHFQLRQPRVIFQFFEILAVLYCELEDGKKSRSKLLEYKFWVDNSSDFSVDNFINYQSFIVAVLK